MMNRPYSLPANSPTEPESAIGGGFRNLKESLDGMVRSKIMLYMTYAVMAFAAGNMLTFGSTLDMLNREMTPQQIRHNYQHKFSNEYANIAWYKLTTPGREFAIDLMTPYSSDSLSDRLR